MRRRALLVGCNYPGSPHQLSGCANDAASIRALLCDLFDYKTEDISVMIDTDSQTPRPTGANIKARLPDLGFAYSSLLHCCMTREQASHPFAALLNSLLTASPMRPQAELNRLVSLTASDDVLFFHFSGHGTQVPTDEKEETDGLDEAIVPTDMNLILDDDLRVITCKIPPGARFTMVSDCCHSGTMLDHKPRQLPTHSSRQLPAGDLPLVNRGPKRNK